MGRSLLVLIFAGCLRPGPFPDPGPDPEGPPVKGAGCELDSDCATGSVCTRAKGCWPASEIYAAHVTWTINGMPASATTCAPLPPLTIEFYGATSTGGGQMAFKPVACAEGKFTLVQLPTVIDSVKLGARDLGFRSTTIDTTTGEAALDLMF